MPKRTNAKFVTAVAAALVLIISAMPGQVQALSDTNDKKKCICPPGSVVMPNSVPPNCRCCNDGNYDPNTGLCDRTTKSN